MGASENLVNKVNARGMLSTKEDRLHGSSPSRVQHVENLVDAAIFKSTSRTMPHQLLNIVQLWLGE